MLYSRDRKKNPMPVPRDFFTCVVVMVVIRKGRNKTPDTEPLLTGGRLARGMLICGVGYQCPVWGLLNVFTSAYRRELIINGVACEMGCL